MSAFDPPLSFPTLLRTFAQTPDPPATAAPSDEHLRTACAELGVAFATDARHIGAPALTPWTFRSQCAGESKSCAAAVARARVLRVGLGLRPCSEGTGAYCKARAELPVALPARLATQLGDDLGRQAATARPWKGRRVLLGDGTTVSGPDTVIDPAAYPQHANPKRGRGFPRIRLVVLVGLATGALVAAAVGPCQGEEAGEMVLLGASRDRFRPGDVFAADRAYGSSRRIAALQARGVDVALRLHQSRHSVVTAGTHRGDGDPAVTWARPARPDRMAQPTSHATPKVLTIREVWFRVDRPGYRTRRVVAATTLTAARGARRPPRSRRVTRIGAANSQRISPTESRSLYRLPRPQERHHGHQRRFSCQAENRPADRVRAASGVRMVVFLLHRRCSMSLPLAVKTSRRRAIAASW